MAELVWFVVAVVQVEVVVLLLQLVVIHLLVRLLQSYYYSQVQYQSHIYIYYSTQFPYIFYSRILGEYLEK